ncbi:MAG: RNA polymerase sigma-70 factor [Agriterribacter sp.]
MLEQNIHIEKNLLVLLKAGDKTAFTSLYQQYAPSLTAFAASKVSSLDEAKDIIHDLFVYIWDQRENIEITSSIKSFLFAAVRYRVIDHIRKNITRREYAAMLHQLSNDITTATEDELVSKNLEHTLEHVVETLPSRTKQIYRLSRNRHLAVKEIANELGLSEQTVKNQLSTALHHLRFSLEKLVIFVILFLSA